MAITPDTLLNDRYRIIKILGKGGMSSVYHAVDENIGVPVAVKANLMLTDDYSRQFQREANILATLRHPNLPRVSDYFFIPGQGQYLVMDFIEGEDLRERIERLDQLPEREVIIMGAAICDALMYLHNRQPPVIHRDIKPGNIKITPEGHVVLVDFGLVKLLEDNQQTTTGARAMTPGYSPPEQYGTGRTDERSDIYSLGATLYAALTGAVPEDGLSRLTGKDKLTPIRKKRSNISERLSVIIEKALEVDADKRYQNAQDFRVALLDAGNMTTIPIENSLVTPPPRRQNEMPAIHTGISQPLISIPLSESIKKSANHVFPWWMATILLILFISTAWEIQTGAISNFFISGNKLLVPESTTTSNPLVIISSSPSPPTLTPDKAALLTPEIETEIAGANPFPTGGGGGLIAYASNEDDVVMQLWTYSLVDGTRKKLTHLVDGACQPTWSPNGTEIAFISPCQTKKELYEGARIFTVSISDLEKITPLPVAVDPSGDFDPAWSPDGQKIVFSSLRPGNAPDSKERLVHLYIYDFKSEELKEITDTRWRDRQPAWSPDGKSLAFARKVSSNEIWQSAPDGSNAKRFSGSTNSNDNYPAYSRDGKIIFFTQQSVNGGIPYFSGKRLADAGLALEFRIPPSGQPDLSPAAEMDVSPDGQWFVFERWLDGENHDIYIASINGANVNILVGTPSFEFAPVWQPALLP